MRVYLGTALLPREEYTATLPHGGEQGKGKEENSGIRKRALASVKGHCVSDGLSRSGGSQESILLDCVSEPLGERRDTAKEDPANA